LHPYEKAQTGNTCAFRQIPIACKLKYVTGNGENPQKHPPFPQTTPEGAQRIIQYLHRPLQGVAKKQSQ